MRLMHHCGDHDDQVIVCPVDGDQPIARFRYDEPDQFVAEGKLSAADLLDQSKAGQAALCRRPALLACARACRHGMACLALDCPHRPASQRRDEATTATGGWPA